MKRVFQLIPVALVLWAVAPGFSAEAQQSKVVVTETASAGSTSTAATSTTTRVAAPKGTRVEVETKTSRLPGVVTAEANDLLERFVTWLHRFFPQVDNHVFHWIACLIVIVLAIVLRHVITNIIFYYLKKGASKTSTTLDDKLFPALEPPTAALVMVLGIYAALTVLQLSPQGDVILGYCGRVAILVVIIWAVIRGGAALLDHAEELAHARKLTVATFMPLIKKTCLVFAIILGVLWIAETLGANIGVLLGSLGIGGLALALAAQDMIANLFGSFVVVMDQPFRVGETVQIGATVGTVEDIGLRSTKLRLVDKSLMVIPNKSVAAESITNLARFTQRRVEQVIGLTYNTRPEQMVEIVDEIRRLITSESEVDPASVLVYFRDYNTSSLDIWIVYVTKTPDFPSAMRLRQRLNLAMMRAVAARGLSFARPTQTIHLDGEVARQLAENRAT